jgi:hypothetical protein
MKCTDECFSQMMVGKLEIGISPASNLYTSNAFFIIIKS